MENSLQHVKTLSMKQAISNVFKNYANFKGRARRSEYWNFHLFNCILVTSLYIISVGAVFFLSSQVNPIFIIGVGELIVLLYGIGISIPNLALIVRRLHDIGKSGWWWLFIVFIPIVGTIFYLIWMYTDSDVDENRYGPSPKYLGKINL